MDDSDSTPSSGTPIADPVSRVLVHPIIIPDLPSHDANGEQFTTPVIKGKRRGSCGTAEPRDRLRRLQPISASAELRQKEEKLRKLRLVSHYRQKVRINWARNIRSVSATFLYSIFTLSGISPPMGKTTVNSLCLPCSVRFTFDNWSGTPCCGFIYSTFALFSQSWLIPSWSHSLSTIAHLSGISPADLTWPVCGFCSRACLNWLSWPAAGGRWLSRRCRTSSSGWRSEVSRQAWPSCCGTSVLTRSWSGTTRRRRLSRSRTAHETWSGGARLLW